ncbi:MAG: rRNA maturation RNase YbeY [Candidatus Epulonipiscioides saccharophilum]|nr:MAG: rRNA maturation RNase YbeY [Epulopiscium sp. AS2M-Bin001]
MYIDIEDQEGLFSRYPALVSDVERVIKECLDTEHINNKGIEISLSIVNKQAIQDINKEFRGIDKPTDVLSFPQYDSPEQFSHLSENIILGDIILCVDIAIEQAIEYNHTLTREVCFLVAHSCFHLLGYDHMTDEEEKIMFAKQDSVLNKLNITR